MPPAYLRMRWLQALLPVMLSACERETPPVKTDTSHAEIVTLIQAWLDVSGVIDPHAFKNLTYRNYARALLDAGYIPQDIAQFVADRQCEDYWQGKAVPFSIVAKDIHRWKAHRSRAGQFTARPPASDDMLFHGQPGEERMAMPEAIRAQLHGLRTRQVVTGGMA